MMNSIRNVLLFTTLVLCVGVANADDEGYSRAEEVDDDLAAVNRRGWNMLRLGRGLQMLRLGKRARLDKVRLGGQPLIRLESSSKSHNPGLSVYDLQNVLSSMMEEPTRDESRRQPPLPRYGRDGSSATRDLFDALALNNEGFFPADVFPSGSSYFRPAPRAGRYKRSADMDTLSDFYLPQKYQDSREFRAVPRPRIGRYLEALSRLQTKAVPRPRIGRNPLSKLDSSSQSDSTKDQ